MRLAIFSWPLVLLAFAGCNVQTGISPTEAVIKKSSAKDFNFEGAWVPGSGVDVPADVGECQLTIERGDKNVYFASIDRQLDDVKDSFRFQFRTAELLREQSYAIVEIEPQGGIGLLGRRLAIARATEKRLHVWMIDGRKVGDLLYEEGYGAVIEHDTFSTVVRCKPEQLVSTVRQHSREIVGCVWSFERKAKAND